jgi:carrier-protein-independent halogenase WelO5-like protein
VPEGIISLLDERKRHRIRRCTMRLAPVPEAIEVGDSRLAIYTTYDKATLADVIRRIKKGEIVAAIFKGAIRAEICAMAARRVAAYEKKERYEGAPGIGRIGQSLYETNLSPFLLVDYFRTAEQHYEVSRSMFAPAQHPWDEMRLMLDDIWPHSVGRLRLEHGLCHLGLLRLLEHSGAILPHNDAAAADAPWSLLAQQIDIQIAINVLIQSSEQGGATRVWPKRFSRSEYEANRHPDFDYALRAECLPPDPVIIRPEAGDLYLFDSSFPHAVEACEGGQPRITQSGFIGVRRDGELVFFS